MSIKTIRPYEMSVWTLRDTYITSLRAYGIENRGQIEEPLLKLSNDGTQTLTFKIPMYLYENNQLIENPRWFDVKHGLLMVNLRKIKVIFNKGEEEEEVFEFLVMKVDEEHNNNTLYCKVECSGLAFQELGKKGYSVSLSEEEFFLEYNEYLDNIEEDALTIEEQQQALDNAPFNNINYWCDKLFEYSDWTYSIQMDWGAYDGYIYRRLVDPTGSGRTAYVQIAKVDSASVNERGSRLRIIGSVSLNSNIIYDENTLVEKLVPYNELFDYEKEVINNLRDELGLRRNDKIYEEGYVTSWQLDEEKNKLFPDAYEQFREKCRMVTSQNSNLYNASQAIAEAFGVYCRYKYYYDDNYHIIGKEVIFYNNFMDELNGVIDLTYNYNLSSITKTMDGNDICTKLIVSNVEDDSNANGLLSIVNVPANKTGENYLLDFDYLYKTGDIEKDQYDAVKEFEYMMYIYNKDLQQLREKINKLDKDINEYEADITINKNTIIQLEDSYSNTISELKSLTKNETGTIQYGPHIIKLLKDNTTGYYYCNVSEKGISGESIRIYKQYDLATQVASDPIETFNVAKDNTGNIIGVKDIVLTESESNYYSNFYISYNYIPKEYYNNLLNYYERAIAKAQLAQEEAQSKLDDILYDEENGYSILKDRYESLLFEKKNAIADFEKMMGPALREGTWQPETYQDYGTKYTTDFVFSNDNSEIQENQDMHLLWDTVPFELEQIGYYNIGLEMNKYYYPCIKIDNNILEKIKNYIYGDYEDIESENLNTNLLQFKYTQTLQHSATYVEENGAYSYTLRNGTTFSANSIEELENQIIKYGLKELGVIENEDEVINFDNISDNVLLNVKRTYGLTIKSNKFFTLGSNMVVSFLEKDNNIIPVLMLTGVEDIYIENSDTLKNLLLQEAQLCYSAEQVVIPSYNKTLDNETETEIEVKDYNEIFSKQTVVNVLDRDLTIEDFIFNYEEDGYTFVYPRLYTSNLLLKTDSSSLTLNTLDENAVLNERGILNEYEDYDVLIRDDGYYITIDGRRLIESGNFNKRIQINFVISNAELNIYLDALEVMKTNSIPQVSYKLDISYLNENITKNLYRQLNRLVHINDFELKFENVYGYISNLDLNLDSPWQDKIEIKNYKTKFEDLFTKIVASTEQMIANASIYNKAASAFNSNGLIKSNLLQSSLDLTSLSLELAGGNLIIDKTEGIRAQNDEGIVLLDGAGIFCATEQNEDGDWLWTSGITPKGINASLLKAGQIDTNLIRIYSGNNLAFQMNSQGLFAFKANSVNESEQTEYVVHNSNGLFLTQEAGTIVEGITLEQNVDRVEISWNGIIIRNIRNEKVFYADNYGNLTLAGTIQTSAGNIGGWNISKNALLSIPGQNVNNVAGMASGMMTNRYNAESPGSNIYKVFWAGADVYGNSKFYVNSNGNVFADSLTVNNSLVAEHITLNGIALEEALPEVREAEVGIHVTPLDGSIFRVMANGKPEESVLQFALSAHGLKYENEETGESDISTIKFYYGTNEYGVENLIENQMALEQINWQPINIRFLTEGKTYLTFGINYDIITQIGADTVYFKVEYKNYMDIFIIQVNQINFNILTVRIESDGGNTFRNGRVVGKEDDVLTLTANVYKNGELVKESEFSSFSFQWYKKDKVIDIPEIEEGEEEEEDEITEEYEDVLIEGATTNTIQITVADLLDNKTRIYTCEVNEI